MTVPSNLKYTESHEWLRTEADGTITVGITEHAQAELGDLVYVELPAAGRKVDANEACCVVESTKAASDVYAPISGEIVTGNDALGDAPQLVNEQPFEGGWLFRIKPANPADLDALLSADDYQQALKD
ncbi:MAG: glycine cleavage system protein GcvH [Lautropia sp.]|nr:glycine cleavage system protein GcvH [Lautropia sp.]